MFTASEPLAMYTMSGASALTVNPPGSAKLTRGRKDDDLYTPEAADGDTVADVRSEGADGEPAELPQPARSMTAAHLNHSAAT